MKFLFLLFIVSIVFGIADGCDCFNPNITQIYNHFTLYPTSNTTTGSYCPNMWCSWKFSFDNNNHTNFLHIFLNYSDMLGVNSSDHFVVYNCLSEKTIWDSFMYCDIVKRDIYVQDDEICVDFNSSIRNSTENPWWQIDFVFEVNSIYLGNVYTFEPRQTMNIMTELFDVTNQTITFTSTENGTLELFIASLNYMLLDPNYVAVFYIYDSMFMTNFIGYYQSNMSFTAQSILSTTNSLTIYSSNINKGVWAKLVFRIKEFYENDCFGGIFYFAMGFTIDGDDYTISANSTHECVYSILIPNLVPYSTLLIYEDAAIPVLFIDNMKYEGSSMVKVKTYLNNYTTLFEFDEKDVSLWHSLYLYGDLISFVIPPNGNLSLTCGTHNTKQNMTITMDDRIKGVATSYFYPAKFLTIPLRFNIFCEKGNAQLNLTIVDASLGPGTYINLYSGGEIKETLNQSFYRNVSRLLEGTMVSIELNGNSVAWNTTNLFASFPNSSLFVRFEGVNIKSISQPKKSIVWIILLVSAIFIVIIIVIILGAVYHMKRKKRYFEELYDMLREMNLPPEEMEKLRRKTDQFRIENNKLHINFNSQLGQGSFSHVYEGHLIGPAPLHLITKSIETQRFCDCEVAVKIGANFGQNEVEQLFKEIEAMKTIGYHENIMGMLGWAMLDEKPCLVFDVAKMDLLKFVKEFRGKSIEGLPMMIKNFLSVLWQVAKGMQYISSKKMIHLDLAARNILLCESYTAKISDFGLCCTCDESSLAYQAVGRSKKLPIKWLSIEALVDRIFSEKSDVWSFGVLMYEMFSLGKVPYATMNNDDVLEFLQEDDKRLECPENTPTNVYDIMRMCWKKEPDERPCFGELVDLLYGMLETLSDEYAVAC